MPISQKLYRWVGIPLLSGALLTVILLSIASFWLVGQNRIYAGSVTRAEQVLDLLARLHTELRTIESGQRGYIITQDDAYLTAYDATRREVGPTIAELEALLSDDPAGAARIAEVKSLGDAKIAELAETVAAVKAGNLAGAVTTVKTGRGLNEMRQLEDLLDGMTAAENEALDIRSHEFAATNTTAKWLDGLGTAATLALALGFWLMTSRYLSTIRAAQGLLAEANANLEQRVRERTQALSRANEEVQRFAYIVSHDLRSPLVNIMGFTSELEAARATLDGWVKDLAERQDIDPAVRQAVDEELPEAIRFIRGSAQKMDRLIKAILQISREGARVLAPEPLDLNQMVDGISATLRTMVEARGAEIAVGRLPGIISDRLTVEQLLSNLLENAVKYLSGERKGRIVVDGEVRGSFVEISVSDNGRGIDARDMERIFELFRRAGPQDQPGEGIGLANVRAQATRLGGTVTCRSTIGVGATFTLTLPRILKVKQEQEAA